VFLLKNIFTWWCNFWNLNIYIVLNLFRRNFVLTLFVWKILLRNIYFCSSFRKPKVNSDLSWKPCLDYGNPIRVFCAREFQVRWPRDKMRFSQIYRIRHRTPCVHFFHPISVSQWRKLRILTHSSPHLARGIVSNLSKYIEILIKIRCFGNRHRIM